jgi:hypothetical protein
MDHFLHLLVDPGYLPIRKKDDQQDHDDAQQGDDDMMTVFPCESDHVPKLRLPTGLLQIIDLTKS